MINKISKLWIYLFLVVFSIIPILNIKISLIINILFLLLLIFVVNKIKLKKFPVVLFLLSFLVRIVFCLLVDTQPVSDFKILLDASKNINLGDFSYNSLSYFQNWSYQMGFVFIQSLFLKIFNNILFLKIINCFVTSVICLLIYYIAKEFMKEKSAQIVSIFYSCMIFPISLVTVLTNQHLSAMFIYLGLFIIISSRIKLSESCRYILSGLLISVGNIIRPEGIITIVSILIYLILTLNKANFKAKFINAICLLGSYFLLFIIVSNIFIVTNISSNGLKNNAPYWKFVLGFNHETSGCYSEQDLYVLGNKEMANNLIMKRVFVSPLKLSKLFFSKINIFWNTSDLSWSFSSVSNESIIKEDSNITNILSSLSQSSLIIIYILFLIGIFKYLRTNIKNNKIIILINQVFVTFGVYLLIEVQSRYVYFIQITLIILMGLGIEFLYNNRKKYQKVLNI